MAATRLIALHINKGKTVAQCLADRTDYSENAAKTEDGKYISAYACDAKTCDEEFLLSKRQYEHITGRTQAHDVIAYQIRQSFKPGEITPEEANKVGYETAMRFTKGKHAFIVATHVDRAHIHNHIIFNSTTLDCTRKFRDFRLSGLALARLSDIVCLEHRLSVIVRKPYGERKKRTEYPEKKSQRDEICEAIDAALERKPKDFQELIGILQEAGYEYKDGKQPALRGKGHARFARFRSLGKGYSVEELCGVIAGNAVHKSKFAEKTRTSARSAQVHQKAELSFLIDVRAKMQAGKGAGYARWAKVFNLKQMAKAMMFMEEHGIKSYAELKEKADEISEKCDALLESVKADEARMSEVSVLRKHLINYAKTKDVFAAYKASGYNQEFYEAHRDTLALRSAAKKAFDAYKKENGSDKKLPRISELNAEYAMLLERKKSSYAEYRKTKSEMQDWLVAQKIVQEILKENEQKKEQLHEQEVQKEEENLIREKIPFIVDGKQIYLPFMAVYLQERCSAEKKPREEMLPSAQMLLLHFIYGGAQELSTSQAAKDLELTPTSISRASRQLEEMGLLHIRKVGVQRIMQSENSPKTLFQKAGDKLLNPIKRTVYIPKELVGTELLESGYSALAEYSMLNTPNVRCYAAERISQWKDVMTNSLQNSQVQVAVEMWRYNPRKLSTRNIVDELSLALALREDADERVEEAVEEMLNELWRKIDGYRN